MRRREFIALLGTSAFAWPLAARAQRRIARVGFLGAASAAGYAKRLEAFRSGLRDFGYVEGQNVVIESRWAQGDYDRLGTLAAELIAQNPDVLVTHGTPATNAAKKATATIPIVMAVSGDAHMTGLIQSLARPGGNVTGLTYFASEQATKRLEVMRDLISAIRRVALLINPENPLVGLERDASESAAKQLNMTVRPFEVRSRAELAGAFSMMTQGGFEGVVVAQDGILSGSASAIAALALRERLPSVGDSVFANGGGLVSFGPNSSEMFRRAAYFVDRILKGTKASELPVERPNKFEMTINLKTAKALGLTVPQALIVRADELIE